MGFSNGFLYPQKPRKTLYMGFLKPTLSKTHQYMQYFTSQSIHSYNELRRHAAQIQRRIVLS